MTGIEETEDRLQVDRSRGGAKIGQEGTVDGVGLNGRSSACVGRSFAYFTENGCRRQAEPEYRSN